MIIDNARQRTHRALHICVWALLLLIPGGCDTPVSSPAATGELLVSELERDTAPMVSEAHQMALSEGNNAFAFDLYAQLAGSEEGNLFFSPLSISTALAMTWVGARNETESQMAETLHYELSQEHLHPAFNWLDLTLQSRGEGAEGLDGEPFRLHIANALWGLDGYGFLSDFLDTLALNYGAGMNLMDFIGDPDGARLTINQWVADQTEDRILNIIPQGAINPSTRLVLTNAVYFNAAWASKFMETATNDGPFNTLNGGQVTVPLMHHTYYLRHMQGENYQAIELPYDGNELSMLIVLPDAGQFEEMEASLDQDTLDAILEGLTSEYVSITMPSFQFKSSFALGDSLKALGMVNPFTDADFSGMDGTQDLALSAVLHKSFVRVNESGTEAAAATAVIATTTSEPPPPIPVIVDRPFIFAIRDHATHSLIFLGRMLNPSDTE